MDYKSISNGLPLSICDLLGKLEYLSLIQRHDKVCFHDFSLVNSKSWLGFLKRTYFGENRKMLLIQINQTINLAIELINEFKNSEYIVLIINALAKSKLGISNLLTTYNNDPNVISQLHVCLSNINLQLDKNRIHLHGHKADTEKQTPSQQTPEKILNKQVVIDKTNHEKVPEKSDLQQRIDKEHFSGTFIKNTYT
jgi:hypothetical protein